METTRRTPKENVMQRWIVIAVLGAILVGLGGGFAVWTFRQNKDDKVWMRQPLNPDLTTERLEQVAVDVKARLLDGSAMTAIVRDTGLAGKLDLPTEDEAEMIARRALFVELDKIKTPQGEVPLLNVGYHCKVKTHKIMEEAAKRTMEEVWKMPGFKRPQQESF